jgi:hypothetical protein
MCGGEFQEVCHKLWEGRKAFTTDKQYKIGFMGITYISLLGEIVWFQANNSAFQFF